MVTTLYILRHGQSEGNHNKVFQGTLDMDLSKLGYTHVDKAAEYFKDTKIDKFYSSKLKRAYKTTKTILDKNKFAPEGTEVTQLEALNEIYAGDIEGKEYDAVAKLYPDAHYALFNNPSTFAPPNGETMYQLSQRVVNCIKELVNENDGKTILITSHGCSIKTMLCYFYGYELKDMQKTPWITHGNCVKVIFEDGKPKKVSLLEIQE